MEIVHTELLANGNLDLYSLSGAAIQYGQSGTKEDRVNSLYGLYEIGKEFSDFKEVYTNATFDEALQWVACGKLPESTFDKLITLIDDGQTYSEPYCEAYSQPK